MLAITNSRFFKADQLIANETILIDKGKVVAFTDGTVPDGYVVVDAEQNYLFPGFVDLQVYGAAKHLFSAMPTLDSLVTIENELLKQGTTSFLICLATNTPEVFNTCIELVKANRSAAKNCLGLHLEGPFINAEKKGAHVAAFIRKATLDEIKRLLDFGDGTIKMMTIAPELQDDNVIAYLIDNGVIVSLGHSTANFQQATNAYNQGVQSTTHLFNAMSPLQHRAPGIPTAVFNHDTAMASIIPDGHHVDFEVIKMAANLMKERLFLITDAVTECNIGPYQHIAENGKYVMPDGTLSGSALTMAQAVKNCVDYCGLPLSTALQMATAYPAKLIREEGKIGELTVGAQANLLLLDNQLTIKNVFFRGEEIKLDKASAI